MQQAFKPQLTPEFIVRSLHLKVPVLHRPHTPFTLITTDSRKVIAGSLFVAIKGEKMDGHQYIDDAITKGARGILCKRGSPISSYKDICIFPVEDTLAAYRRVAAAWRREFSIPMIVVAGSAGKTTTKELLASILQGKWEQVLKTEGSQNGFLGIPMTLLELRPEHEVAVIEVGIDEIGAMQQHIQLVTPTAAVLTAIGPEHLENLRDIPTVAREEGHALTLVAKAGGILAINMDDPWIKPHFTTLKEGRRIPFSFLQESISDDSEMISGRLSDDGKELSYQGLGIPESKVKLPLPGKHNASNLLAAITIAAGLGLTRTEINRGLKNFKGVSGRSEVRGLPGPLTVICDYYNAQPASMEAGLELLSQLSKQSGKKGVRWACLADMLELGPEEDHFHRALAEKLIQLQIENVVLYGPRMAALFDELRNRNFAGKHAHFTSHSDLATALTESVKPGDVILIKGSRGMKMEEVWKLLEPYAKTHWSPSTESKNTSAYSGEY